MDSPEKTLIEAGSDAVRAYTDDEYRHIALNHQAITRLVYSGEYSEQALDLGVLCSIHRQLFSGVRGHAGKHRARNYGTERLVFGRCRSPDRREVGKKLEEIFERFRVSINSLRANSTDPQYPSAAFHLAAWVHAELVHVHPFEDGNGRTARLFMNAVLIKLGYPPVGLEAHRDEYIQCLDHYYLHRELEPFRDLLVRLASDSLASEISCDS